METISKTTFFSLPVELRLQIAKYALEQGEDMDPRQSIEEVLRGTMCHASSNLSILLVCREFQRNFTNIAYRLTRFCFLGSKIQAPFRAPHSKLQNLRRVIVDADWSQIDQWQIYPFNEECIVLQELCIVSLRPDTNFVPYAISLLCRLQNVKNLKFFPTFETDPQTYAMLIGAIYKEDHYLRYDVSGAPIVRKTWWKPQYHSHDTSFDFKNCDAEPVMAEEDYMVMMKPKMEELMDWMDRLSQDTIRES